jgi:tRNA modification GTPase
MVYRLADTIVAIATAVVPAQGSIGIVRLSGSLSLAIAQKIFHPCRPQWQSHQFLYGWIQNAQGQTLDEALVVWMQAPRSYTREDVVEFHCHGGIMVVQATLQACLAQGARLADPGEFTLRAFLNGRIDLTQAESISDLIHACSPEAAQMAVAGIQGKISQKIQSLRQQALHLLGELEARLDFEEDLPPLDLAFWIQALTTMQKELEAILSTAERGSLLRTGLKVAIVGQPNVGKSSLLNAWSGQDRAIVTDLPGTTRDVVESHLVVKGIPIQLLDTAGIRETEDYIEKLGVERSYRLAQDADILVLVVSAPQGWTEAEAALYEQIRHRPVIVVVNKVDLCPLSEVMLPRELNQVIPTIASQEQGIPDLENAIETLAYQKSFAPTTPDIAINQRHQAILVKAKASLDLVQQAIDQDLPLDFWTIDLRTAIQLFGEVTGEEITESVLDRIFSQFCIGK